MKPAPDINTTTEPSTGQPDPRKVEMPTSPPPEENESNVEGGDGKLEKEPLIRGNESEDNTRP